MCMMMHDGRQAKPVLRGEEEETKNTELFADRDEFCYTANKTAGVVIDRQKAVKVALTMMSAN